MFKSNRIIYLNEKFKNLTKYNLYVNALNKQLSQAYFEKHNLRHFSVLSSCMAAGSASNRKNKFYNAIPFRKDWKGVTIFMDAWITELAFVCKSDFNVALLSESKSIKPDIYAKVEELEEHFDLILTYDQKLLSKFPHKARFVPADTPILGPQYIGLNLANKKYPISHIYSEKTFSDGHKLRHKIANKYRSISPEQIHLLGSGTDGIRKEEKGDLIAPYLFSIAIENSKYDYYFTEKILDCFISGTIPIYWGCSSIGDYFDSSGIITFNDFKDLDEILSKIKEDPSKFYGSMSNAAINNLELSKRFMYIDDIFLLEILEFISTKGKLAELAPMLLNK